MLWVLNKWANLPLCYQRMRYTCLGDHGAAQFMYQAKAGRELRRAHSYGGFSSPQTRAVEVGENEDQRNIPHRGWAAMTRTSAALFLSDRKRLIFTFDTVTVQSSPCNYVLLILCYPAPDEEDLFLSVQLLTLAGVYGSYGFKRHRLIALSLNAEISIPTCSPKPPCFQASEWLQVGFLISGTYGVYTIN